MCSTKRSPRSRGTLVLLACLVVILATCVPGCSPGGGVATLSPEAQAKAKEDFKKRFDNSAEEKGRKTPGR
jgi:hypothetical protein